MLRLANLAADGPHFRDGESVGISDEQPQRRTCGIAKAVCLLSVQDQSEEPLFTSDRQREKVLVRSDWTGGRAEHFNLCGAGGKMGASTGGRGRLLFG